MVEWLAVRFQLSLQSLVQLRLGSGHAQHVATSSQHVLVLYKKSVGPSRSVFKTIYSFRSPDRHQSRSTMLCSLHARSRFLTTGAMHLQCRQMLLLWQLLLHSLL